MLMFMKMKKISNVNLKNNIFDKYPKNNFVKIPTII